MARLHIRLTPRASREGVDGWGEDAQGRTYLKVRITTPPVDGKANAALIAFMAKALGVGKSKITLVSGDTARLKTLEIDGLDAQDLSQKLGSQT